MSAAESASQPLEAVSQIVNQPNSESKPSRKTSQQKASSRATKSTGRRSKRAKVWTVEEKNTLLKIVNEKGASIKHFEGALLGRSGLACYVRWRVEIMPSIFRSFAAGRKTVGAK